MNFLPMPQFFRFTDILQRQHLQISVCYCRPTLRTFQAALFVWYSLFDFHSYFQPCTSALKSGGGGEEEKILHSSMLETCLYRESHKKLNTTELSFSFWTINVNSDEMRGRTLPISNFSFDGAFQRKIVKSDIKTRYL